MKGWGLMPLLDGFVVDSCNSCAFLFCENALLDIGDRLGL